MEVADIAHLYLIFFKENTNIFSDDLTVSIVVRTNTDLNEILSYRNNPPTKHHEHPSNVRYCYSLANQLVKLGVVNVKCETFREGETSHPGTF